MRPGCLVAGTQVRGHLAGCARSFIENMNFSRPQNSEERDETPWRPRHTVPLTVYRCVPFHTATNVFFTTSHEACPNPVQTKSILHGILRATAMYRHTRFYWISH